ncbi:hypothetical protein J2W32_006538 [Variovorax boronicumulans]|uniref:Uncharacterized protein n=1 Tax=Variovorax boronicumulans TaxID=436515 RepID=A0AAW8D4Q8_9BURK|nr:hypothetical protein [Variovorax boronicumulans]MDP9897397.1 hypothetical protein [Variovorax boronicumulans]MDQ0057461.1 hypothetical protein [Variovorax boronicumulans]
MVIVDEVITNHEYDKAWRWIDEFARATYAAHRGKFKTLDQRGLRIWGAVLYQKHAGLDPLELTETVPFAPEFFDHAFVTKGVAWIESFRASWMANEIDPEDVDDRGISLLWGPLMYVDRGNADPILLAQETRIPDEFMPLLFPTYRHESSGWPAPDGPVPF